jgi:pimeloyl-ACP methyl ester carboxylesterase
MKKIIFSTLFTLLINPALSYSKNWSLNWSYQHTKETAKLPLYSANMKSSELFRLKANGLEFRVRSYGKENSGDSIIMLHGFPSSSIMWDDLAKKAAQADFKVYSYDQRGYSPGARPKGGITQYTVNKYIADLLDISKKLKVKKLHLVGHDVGCVISWVFAMKYPNRVKSLNCLSVSNPATLIDQLITNPPTYIKIFTKSVLPEMILRFNNAHYLRGQYEAMSENELSEYHSIYTEPGSLKAPLNFYRAIKLSITELENTLKNDVLVPTLFMYGKGEQWVSQKTLAEQKVKMKGPYEVMQIENAGKTGHFILEHQREEVSSRVLDHIRRWSN